jgi:pimeloyl-ACP methyl ester carboxylesterase
MPQIYLRARRLAYEVRPSSYRKSDLSVVLIHGSGGDREDWRAQLDGLSHIANILALELPGHGESEGPGECTVEAFAQWVIDFVNSLALEKVILMGCSLGSAVTQWIALTQRPLWLKGLGLVGAGARLRVHPALLSGLAEDKDTALTKLAELCLSPVSDRYLHEKIRSKYLHTSAELLRDDLSACNAFDVMEKVRNIALPTLIVVGEDDMLTPLKYAKFLNRSIQGSMLKILPQAGHFVMMEQSEKFNAAFGDFLAQLKE